MCIYLNLFACSADTVEGFISDSRWCVGTCIYFVFLLFFFSFLFFCVGFCSSQMEEDPFNPDYVEVDRVLEVSYCEDKDTGEVKEIFFSLLILPEKHVFVVPKDLF